MSENMNVNIKNINFETDGGIFNGQISVEVNNNNSVEKLMERLQKINGIEKVFRV